jgi:hypothetical protein
LRPSSPSPVNGRTGLSYSADPVELLNEDDSPSVVTARNFQRLCSQERRGLRRRGLECRLADVCMPCGINGLRPSTLGDHLDSATRLSAFIFYGIFRYGGNGSFPSPETNQTSHSTAPWKFVRDRANEPRPLKWRRGNFPGS